MFDKDQLLVGAIMLGIAIWGGIVGYYRKVQAGMEHTWFRFFGEISASALAGICLGMAGLSAEVNIYMCLALAGIGGHLGTAFFDIGQDIIRSFLERVVNKPK